MSDRNKPISERRKFILNSAKSIGLVSLGGLVWSAYIKESVASQLLLRPPGALNENEFLKQCIKCGLCVQACPYDTLHLAKPEENQPVGTPYFEPRQKPCYMCVDIPCTVACPTDALDIPLVSDEITKKLDISKAKMGLAVIDDDACIAFNGIQCDACHRACPLINEAITLEYHTNQDTGKHANMVPIVHSEKCTGCGLCEHACVTKKASIFVLPLAMAKGEADTHYIQFNTKVDEVKGNKRPITTTTKISEKSAIDSLNDDMDFLK